MANPRLRGITALILAGGQGSRMGGVDKGLQAFRGRPLVTWVIANLQPQVDGILLNANRHLDGYADLGYPVVADEVAGFAGPLAGMLAGLANCPTDWMVTAPCDSPYLPPDWVSQLHDAALKAKSPLAMVVAPERSPSLSTQALSDNRLPRKQPVFCLIHRSLQADLAQFLQEGYRKIDAWTARHGCVEHVFDFDPQCPWAFSNLNTLHELGALEQLQAV